MLSRSRLEEYFELYREDFEARRDRDVGPGSLCEAAQWFRDRWDSDETDFAAMLTRALQKAGPLLANVTPSRQDLLSQARKNPEGVRHLLDIVRSPEDALDMSRLQEFESAWGQLTGKSAEDLSCSQSAVYLQWLCRPDDFFPLDLNETDALSAALGGENPPGGDPLLQAQRICQEVCRFLEEQQYTGGSWPQLDRFLDRYGQSGFHALTADFCTWTVQQRASAQDADALWQPAGWDPGITQEQWAELLKDSSVFTPWALTLIRCLQDCGGEASCSMLSRKYGRQIHFYRRSASALGWHVSRRTGCPVAEGKNGGSLYWAVPFLVRQTAPGEAGICVYRIRDELKAALEQTDLSGIPLSTGGSPRFWWLTFFPGPGSPSTLQTGQLYSCPLHTESGRERPNFRDAGSGDRVVCFEAGPAGAVTALGEVEAALEDSSLNIRMTEHLASPVGLSLLKSCPALEHSQCLAGWPGTLSPLAQTEYDVIADMVRAANPPEPPAETIPYTRDDFLRDVFLSPEQYGRLTALLLRKKNIVLQGPPGVGKTFAARRLAWSLLGERNSSRTELVQFHQNCSYEDFVLGWRPGGDGFELRQGVFTRFCRRAASDPDHPYFFLIDEINRGNLSRIFGELLMLIEDGWRGTSVSLSPDGSSFTVPPNLYIIGMMNTADRSLALIDYALRRRFSFFTMEPGFRTEGFRRYRESLRSPRLDALIDRVEALNEEIARTLGPGFCIGHSFFCGCPSPDACTEEWLQSIVDFDLIPTLEEYWFDDPGQVEKWSAILRGEAAP